MYGLPNNSVHILHNKIKPIVFALILCFVLTAKITYAQTKRALVIGLGVQQDKAWNKINGDKDVPYVLNMLKQAGFKHITTLVNKQATKTAIVTRLKKLAATCNKDDVVYVQYSGHGQQMTDVHNDETDGLDECWIPYDAYRKPSPHYHGEKHLTDDELNVLLHAIRHKIGAKGRMLVVIDACHSGDGTRTNEEEVVRGVTDTFKVTGEQVRGWVETLEWMKTTLKAYRNHEAVVNPKAVPLHEPWITLSACNSYQVNYEMKSPAMGKLTYALCQVMKNSERLNNEALLKRMHKWVNTGLLPQHPILTGEDKNKYNITEMLSK